MGHTATAIPFFSGDIVIDVLCCTRDDHINRKMSLDQFTDGQRMNLEELSNGEYRATREDGAFIQGPEVE